MGFIADLFSNDNEVGPEQQMGLTNIEYEPQIHQYQKAFDQNNQLLGQAAMGGGPLATLNNAQTSQNAAQAAGVYANNRAINPALAARAAAGMQSQAGQQAAQLNAQQRMGALQAQQQGINSMFGNTVGAINGQNSAKVGHNQTQAGIGAGNAAGKNGIMGGILGGAGAALGLAQGGQVPRMSHRNPMIEAHQHIMNMRAGGSVPGKAQVSGDSQKNDTVPAMLSPGEIVIPRSKAQNPDAAKAFVEAVLSGKHKKRGK